MATVLLSILGVIVLFGGVGFIVALVALAKSR
ncbi:MAG: hypothetical protein JWO18_2112 [Microbacteriaceae bacterium]|jgi:hypothetical protein|nr:hypothetical protein [Microbacteriaceae bacterium]